MIAATALTVLAAAALAAFAVAALDRWRARLPVARVDRRTLHAGSIPRAGGVALWVGFIPLALTVPAPAWLRPTLWAVPWALLAAVSLRDDMRSVSVSLRLAVHLLAAGGFAWLLGMQFALPWWTVVGAAVLTAWALNLYNFMDGSDGLALTMTVVGFTAFGGVVLARGEAPDVPLALAAAAAPLLVVNRPPARMFIGDVGAIPIGFLAAAFGIGGVAGGAWSAWFPLLVFLPFGADATVTLIRRVVRGERFWEAHRAHYYQRLHRLGAGHAGTLALYGGLMIACATSAVVCELAVPDWGLAALGAWCAVHGLLFAAIDYHWRRSELTT
ncbi:MAG: glycosyl transferase [Burkholderiales bacterium]|nr:glycosyl transferase [Burkholderiales bacterium]